MGFTDAVGRCLGNYATFAGRARRSEFWYFWLFNLLVQIVASGMDNMLLGGAGVLSAVASLALLLPGLAVSARRLHDGGRSGWWLLIGLVPLVGVILLIIWYVGRGEDGPNRFGADPRAALADPAAHPSARSSARPWDRPGAPS